jgi:hypothetical protein
VETTQVEISDAKGNALEGSRALLWGNNAAWLCHKCDRLLGNRTSDSEFRVECSCGTRYEITRAPNKNGKLNLGAATGVRLRELDQHRTHIRDI